MTSLTLLHRLACRCLIPTLIFTACFFSSCDDDEEDKIPPEIAFSELADGGSIWGIATIAIEASDKGGIEKVDVYVDGVLLTSLSASPYETQWDTNVVPEGNHTLKIVGVDRSGNTAEKEITVIVNNDEFNDATPPHVELTAPLANATVWGTVSISANVTDNRSVNKVEFLVNEAVVSTLTAPPFTASLNTSSLTDGNHVVKVRATDKANNKTEKQVTAVVRNTLISITVPANMLYNGGVWTQRGFVFLNNTDGKLIASAEFQNGQHIELKASSDFSGETFMLTQVRYSASNEDTDIDFWTYTQVSPGKWVLMSEIPDDEDYAGVANLTFTTPAANAFYFAEGNGDDNGYVDPFTNKPNQPIRLQSTPSKLYVTKTYEDGAFAPAYRLYSNISVGNNTINLNQLFTTLTKIDVQIPSNAEYVSIDYHGYIDNSYKERYDLGYYGAPSGVFSVYKPGNAFPTYWTTISVESADYNLFRTTTAADQFDITPLTYSGSFNYSANKLTYNVTGNNIDVVATSYYKETNDLETSWAFVGPTSTTGLISIPELPAILKDFPLPVMNASPAMYSIAAFEEINDYPGFLNYIRNSTYGIDQLYQDGKNAADMSIFQDASSNGRLRAKYKHRHLTAGFKKSKQKFIHSKQVQR